MFNEIQAAFFVLRKWKENPMQTKREIGIWSHWQKDLPENDVALSEEEVSEMKDFLRKNTSTYYTLFPEEKVKSTHVDDKNDFAARFREMSDQALIEAFNREVGNTGWVSARATYHAALRDEFNNREIDYSAIGNSQCLSFGHKIKLNGKKVVIE